MGLAASAGGEAAVAGPSAGLAAAFRRGERARRATHPQNPPHQHQAQHSPQQHHQHHQHHTSLADRIARRLHRVRLRLNTKRDVDLDEEEGPPPERHRPDRLEAISRTTRFSRQEIRYIYRTFKQECPSGAINEATFKSIYAKFFPLGDSSQYAHYVFAALDRSHSGTVTFGDLMLGLSVVMKGTLHERLRWVFSLYDVNHDGCITRQEMLEVISAIYNLVGDAKDASHTHRTPQQHVERIFKKLDLNHDGVITVDEFINYCSADENVRNSFAVFDDLW